MAARSAWAWVYWYPVRHREQALFAEALSQSLAAGLDISNALVTSANAIPSPRFRAALREMLRNCRCGYDLETSLAMTGVGVSRDLLAAIEMGDRRGRLIEHLHAFACRSHARPGDQLAIALRRPVVVRRFAAALAGLLESSGLTVRSIEEAGLMAGGTRSTFVDVVKRIIQAMRGGVPWPEALAREPITFDALFCKLAGSPKTCEHLQAVLARLSGETEQVWLAMPHGTKTV